MNKIFLALFVFGFAIAAAQPTKQSQCAVNEKVVTNLANLVDRVAKGQGTFSFVTFVGNNFLGQTVSFGICQGVVFSRDKIHCLDPSKQPRALANL